MKPLVSCEEAELLLQKYFDGETTLEEEQQLRDWATSDALKSAHSAYHSMLQYFDSERQIDFPELTEQTTMTSHIAVDKKRRSRQKIYLWSSVAAAVVLVVMSINFIRYQQVEAEKDRLLAQQNEMSLKAFGEMADAMMFLSNTLNKGLNPVAKAAEAADITREGNALSALGSALSSLNRVTAMLMPEQAPVKEPNTVRDSGI